MSHDYARMANLCDRFEGVDIMCRRSANWPNGPWRARLVCSKNERADYRIVAYGRSQEEAEENLLMAVYQADQAAG